MGPSTSALYRVHTSRYAQAQTYVHTPTPSKGRHDGMAVCQWLTWESNMGWRRPRASGLLDFWTGLHSEYEQDLRAGQKKKNHSNLHVFARGLIVPEMPAITMEDSCIQLASLTYSPVFSKPPNLSCHTGSRR